MTSPSAFGDNSAESASKHLNHTASNDGFVSSASSITMSANQMVATISSTSEPATPNAPGRPSAEKERETYGKAEPDGSEAPPPRRSKVASIMLVAVCFIGMVLNISCVASASISLPKIGQDFDVEEDALQWIISAFSLSSGCFLIFFGRLADLYGRKKAFLLGTAWLGAFSLGCGFAQDINTLYVLRGLQGLGPAALVPAAIGILAHAFPPGRARSTAFATFSGGAPVGGAIGLQIGGILTQWAPSTWRAPFYLSAGLAFLVVLGGMYYIDKDKPSTETDKRVDWLGVILVTLSLSLITFVMGQGELAPQRWKTPYIIALLVIGIVLLFAFIAWEHFLESDTSVPPKHAPPLMKLSMWKRAKGKFAAMQTIAFFEWASFQSWTFWAQLYYQDYVGLDPILTAIRFLPMFIVGISCNFIVAMVIGHIPGVILVVLGTALTGCAGLFFAVINPSATYWAFGFPASFVSVFGADFVFACGTIFVAKVCLPHEQSLAGGLFQTLTQLGTAIGLAATTILHNSVQRQKETESGVDAELEAYQAAQWLVFAFGIFSSAIAIVFLRNIGTIGDRKKKPKAIADDAEAGRRDEKSDTDVKRSPPSQETPPSNNRDEKKPLPEKEET